MTDESCVVLFTLLSRARHEYIRSWADGKHIRYVADFWAEQIQKVNNAQIELRELTQRRYRKIELT